MVALGTPVLATRGGKTNKQNNTAHLKKQIKNHKQTKPTKQKEYQTQKQNQNKAKKPNPIGQNQNKPTNPEVKQKKSPYTQAGGRGQTIKVRKIEEFRVTIGFSYVN